MRVESNCKIILYYHFRLPEPEPLRHNISNYINTAKKFKTPSSDTDEDIIGEDEIANHEDSGFIIRESEIGPEVTHIYQIENKVILKFDIKIRYQRVLS